MNKVKKNKKTRKQTKKILNRLIIQQNNFLIQKNKINQRIKASTVLINESDSAIESFNQRMNAMVKNKIEVVISRLLSKYDLNTVLNITSEVLAEKMKASNTDKYKLNRDSYSFRIKLKNTAAAEGNNTPFKHQLHTNYTPIKHQETPVKYYGV